jgi:uncharacterized protein YjiS (DUF1127 family)
MAKLIGQQMASFSVAFARDSEGTATTSQSKSLGTRRQSMAMTKDRMILGFLGNYERYSARPSLWAIAGAAVDNVVTKLLDWQERARQRRQLLTLDETALKDFGRSRADAAREGTKPFWRT